MRVACASCAPPVAACPAVFDRLRASNCIHSLIHTHARTPLAHVLIFLFLLFFFSSDIMLPVGQLDANGFPRMFNAPSYYPETIFNGQ